MPRPALALALLFAAPVAAADPATNPLFGDWKLKSATGGPLAAKLQANVSRVLIDADAITAGRPAEYTLDAAKKQFDVAIAGGPKDERGTYKGTYKLDGGTLTLHLAPPGKDRPAGFEPTADGVLMVLTKDKK